MLTKTTAAVLSSVALLGSNLLVEGRPNIIIMQPDDFRHLDTWSPPPNTMDDPFRVDSPPLNEGSGMKYIDSLRTNGLEMMQAYTASPWCGTSRFSTITGRMPSRSSWGRDRFQKSSETEPQDVTIPNTKLADIESQESLDCSQNNLAAVFQDHDYRTGMFGKWHLSDVDNFNYADNQATVQQCGFEAVEGLYVENLGFSDGTFSHNMEWITHEAITFINETAEDESFFMYFNPTVPHSSGDVGKAIKEFDCWNTADPNYGNDEIYIKGMTEYNCRAYRDSIVERANGVEDDLGKIWVDDAVGALLHALRDNNVLNNTLFLFQEDHGMDSKGALYEGGIRIPQFIHYPDEIPAGTQFHGLVSTVDIAATVMDYAGIEPPYDLDGMSWKDAIDDPVEGYWQHERCLFFEDEQDRAVRCGCFKYLDLFAGTDDSTTRDRGDEGNLARRDGGMLFDLCGGGTEYITQEDAIVSVQDVNQCPETSEDDDCTYNNREKLESLLLQSRWDRKKTELANALACHTQNTHPDNEMDFSVCYATDSTETPVTDDPTEAPVIDSSPTAAPSLPLVQCIDSPLNALNRNNVDHNCDWAALEPSRCGRHGWKTHCRLTCGNCEDDYADVDSEMGFLLGDDVIGCDSVTPRQCSDPDVTLTCPNACNFIAV